MEENSLSNIRPAWQSALLLIIVILVSFVIIGPMIGVVVAIPFMEDGIMGFMEKAKDPAGHPEIKTPLLIMQTFATFIGLAAGPALYWWTGERKNPFHLLSMSGTTMAESTLSGNATLDQQFLERKTSRNYVAASPQLLAITAVLVIAFMPVNSIFIEWNSSLEFPEWMGSFARFVKESEAQNSELIKLFTTFDSFGQFIFALLTISVLAGFCEELCFRGMLQPLIMKVTKNPHAAIWITAILFSAFHLQFFGFVPRMLLGAMFGYFYYWTGNLVIPMFAHMINNGVGVLALYLSQKSVVDFDPEKIDSLPWPAVAAGAVVFTVVMVYFYQTAKRSKPIVL